MYEREIKISSSLNESFFLWGSRQTGKSTLLKMLFSDAVWIDLLKADEFRRYLEHPEYLRTELIGDKRDQLVIIDEIQKIPALLDEAHWLIENRNTIFGLCGSSARKLKRGHANLLGGRAIRYELFGLTSKELGSDFDLNRILNNGYLPRHYMSKRPVSLLRSYVSDYLKEEIAAEGLVRNLPAFSGFLDKASLSDTELVNFSNIARECSVSSHTIKEYFQILEDTLLGRWLPSYRKRPKRRVINASKFYFSDVGVVNYLAKRKELEHGSSLYGKAFENWIFHELSSFNAYSESYFDLSYWRLASGIEVDFIIGDMEIAIEAKATKRVTFDHLKGLHNLKKDHPNIIDRVIVCLEPKERLTEDNIFILPYKNFIKRLRDDFNFKPG